MYIHMYMCSMMLLTTSLTVESLQELLATIQLVHELIITVVVMYMYEVLQVVVGAGDTCEVLVTV